MELIINFCVDIFRPYPLTFSTNITILSNSFPKGMTTDIDIRGQGIRTLWLICIGMF